MKNPIRLTRYFSYISSHLPVTNAFMPVSDTAIPLRSRLIHSPTPLPPILQPRHNHRPILDNSSVRPLALHHEIRRQAQLRSAGHVGSAKRALHLLGIIRDNGDVVPPGHQLLRLLGRAVHVVGEDLDHVLLGVGRGAGGAARAVGGDVERLVVVEELEDVAGWRRVDDGGGDELVHGFVVGRVGGVVHEARAARVDRAAEEGEADGAPLRDAR